MHNLYGAFRPQMGSLNSFWLNASRHFPSNNRPFEFWTKWISISPKITCQKTLSQNDIIKYLKWEKKFYICSSYPTTIAVNLMLITLDSSDVNWTIPFTSWSWMTRTKYNIHSLNNKITQWFDNMCTRGA